MKTTCTPELIRKLEALGLPTNTVTVLTDFVVSTEKVRPHKRLYSLEQDLKKVAKELNILGPVDNVLSPSQLSIIENTDAAIKLLRKQYKYAETEIYAAYKNGNLKDLEKLEKLKDKLGVRGKQLVDAVNLLKQGKVSKSNLDLVTSEVSTFVKEAIQENKELAFQKVGLDASKTVADLLNTLAKIKAGVLSSSDLTPKVKSAIHTLIGSTEKKIAKDIGSLKKEKNKLKYKKGKLRRLKRRFNDLATTLSKQKRTLKKTQAKIKELESKDKTVPKRLVLKEKTDKHFITMTENSMKLIAKESNGDIESPTSRKYTLISRIKRIVDIHLKKLRDSISFINVKISKSKAEKKTLNKILNKIAKEERLTAEELTLLEMHSKEFLVRNGTDGIKSSAEILKEALPNVSKHIKPSKSKLAMIPALISNSFTDNKLSDVVKVMLASMHLSPADSLKIESTLRTLHTRMKNVVTNPILSKTGKAVSITEDGDIVYPVKGVNSINMLEAFYEDGYVLDPEIGLHKATLHPVIAEAIKVGQLLAVGSAQTVINNLNAKSDKDLLQDLGLAGKELVQYRIMLNAGKVPEAVLMKEIMPVVLDYVGVRFNKGIDRDIAPLFEKSLQGLILQNLKLNAVNNTGSMLYTTKVLEDDGTYTVSPSEQLDIGNGKKLNILHFKQPSKDLKEAVKEFGYLSESNSRGKATLTPKKPKETIVNSPVKLSPEMKKEVEHDNNVGWYFSKDTQALVDAYYDDKEKLLTLLGKQKVDLTLPVREVMKIRSVNSKLERELDELVAQYVSLTNNGRNKKVKFFVEHGITKAFRNTIRSSLNVQESKLHREFTHTDAIPKKIEAYSKRKPTDISLDNINNEEMFEIFLSQAFDLDPDKNGKLQVFKDIRSIVDIYHKDGVKVMDSKFQWLQDFLDKPKLDMLDLPPEAHKLGKEHAIRGVVELWHLNKSKQKGDSSYTTTLSGEADAITSGVILQLLQVGTKKSLEMVEKGGIYTEDRKEYWEAYTKKLLSEKHNVKESEIEFNSSSLIEAGAYHVTEKGSEHMTIGKHTYSEPFADLYTTIGLLAKRFKSSNELPEAVSEAIAKHLPELTLKEWRALSKPPVMTFNYGMALDNIIKEMALDMFAPLFLKDAKFRDYILEKAKITDYYTNPKNFLVYNKEKDTFVPPKEVNANMSAEFIEQSGLTVDDRIIQALTDEYENYLGEAFRKSLEEVFGEITTLREALTSAEHVVAESFDTALQTRLKGIELADGKVTEEAVNKVLQDLEDEGLLHGITIEGTTQPLLKKDNTDNTSSVQSYVTIDPKITGTNTMLDGKKYTYNGGAAGTISIHRIDGRIIIKSIGKDGFINIYDAIIFGSDNNDVQKGSNSYQHNTVKYGLGYHNFTNLMSQTSEALQVIGGAKNPLTPAIVNLAYAPVQGKMHQEVIVNNKKLYRDTYANSEGVLVFEYAEGKDGRKFIKKKAIQKGEDLEILEYTSNNESMKKLTTYIAKMNGNKPKDKHTKVGKIADRGTVKGFNGSVEDVHTLMNVPLKGKTSEVVGSNIIAVDYYLASEIDRVETPTRTTTTLDKSKSPALTNLLKLSQGNLNNLTETLNKAMTLSTNRVDNLEGKTLFVNHLGMVNTLPQKVKVQDKLPMTSDDDFNNLKDYYGYVTYEFDKNVFETVVKPFMIASRKFPQAVINNTVTATEFVETLPKSLSKDKEIQNLVRSIQRVGLGIPVKKEPTGANKAQVDEDVAKILDMLQNNEC